MAGLRLYTYFRSSAAYRVRIALNLKGLDYTAIPIHLLRDGGEQHSAAFVGRNPTRLVPVLEDGALTLTQSLAIIQYIDEIHPATPLLPADPAARAWVRSLALSIACDIHPLNNLRVMHYLDTVLHVEEEQRKAWACHWITQGFGALERLLADSSQRQDYCHGSAPTLADCCLVPQVFNAQRLRCPLDAFPTITRIYQHCAQLPAFQRAAPEAQADAQ